MLRLLPGEETIFELRVVNHGDPSNISVDTSPPLIKAMRLKRSNHYVEREEVIPVLARMPDNMERIDGVLVVTSESETSRIPISLLSEAEDFEEKGSDEDDEANFVEIKDDYDAYGGEDKEEDLEEEKLPDPDAVSYDDGDYQSHGSHYRREVAGDGITPERRKHQGYAHYADHDKDQSWSDPGSMSSQDPYVVEKETSYYSRDINDSSGQETSYQEAPFQSSDDIAEDEAETRGGLFGLDIAAEKIVPIIMLVLIVVVLALTFYTSTIPEFLGALTSSILIVTLIIYGAATLLKA